MMTAKTGAIMEISFTSSEWELIKIDLVSTAMHSIRQWNEHWHTPIVIAVSLSVAPWK